MNVFKYPFPLLSLFPITYVVKSSVLIFMVKYDCIHMQFSVFIPRTKKKKSMSSKFQEDWSVYMATKRRFMKLKMNEFDEEFNEEMAEDIKVDRTWKTSNFGLKCFLILCNHIFQHLKY